MKKILLFCILSGFYFWSYAQKRQWEIFAGANYSTINAIRLNQQVVLAFRQNSPGYKLYPQIGIQFRNKITDRIKLQTGLKIQRKGDKLGTNNLIPIDTIYSTYLDYFTIPLNLEIQAVPQKSIYWVGGISSSILFHQSKNRGASSPAVNKFTDKDRFELAMQTGLRFDLTKRFGVQILLSKGITNLNYIDRDTPDSNYRYQTMHLEGTISYKLNVD